jgi:hypothetical protein
MHATQTGITSLRHNSLVVGGNSQDNYIDFGSDNVILFDIDDTEKFRVDAAGVDVTGGLTTTTGLDSSSATSGKPLITLNTTNATTTTSSELKFQKTATGQDTAQVGKISFWAHNNVPALKQFGEITSTIAAKDNGTEKGTMELKVATYNGTPTTGLVIQGTSVNGRVDVYLGGGGTSYTNSRGPFSTTGTITATLDITAYSSDKRLKKDIVIIENPLEKLQKLSGFTYHWNKEKCKKAGFKPNDEKQVGMFAQDVQEVIPEAVKIAPFDQDENGESKSGDNYLTVQYEKIIPLLIESNKALLKRVEELEELVKHKIN